MPHTEARPHFFATLPQPLSAFFTSCLQLHLTSNAIQFIAENQPKPPPPATCTKYKEANPKFVRGLVQLAGKDKKGTREVYCECSIADGCWTLVASIHEDNVKAKCDKKDLWATTDGGKNANNKLGTGNWFSNSKFGAAAQATKDDYKSSDYSSLQAHDIMIWHVPNDTPADQYFAKSTYRTSGSALACSIFGMSEG